MWRTKIVRATNTGETEQKNKENGDNTEAMDDEETGIISILGLDDKALDVQSVEEVLDDGESDKEGEETGNDAGALDDQASDVRNLTDLNFENLDVQSVQNVLDKGNITKPKYVEGDMAMWLDSFIQMVELLLNAIHFYQDGKLGWLFGNNI